MTYKDLDIVNLEKILSRFFDFVNVFDCRIAINNNFDMYVNEPLYCYPNYQWVQNSSIAFFKSNLFKTIVLELT
jgi:hypothetical protein